jgi:hypothetical protein
VHDLPELPELPEGCPDGGFRHFRQFWQFQKSWVVNVAETPGRDPGRHG